MAARRKILPWLLLVVVVIIAIAVPVLTDRTWSSWLKLGVDEYLETAEQASQIGDDDDDDADSDENDVAAPLVVALSDEVVDAAGIKVTTLKEQLFFPESNAFASVVDVRDLIQSRLKLKQLHVAQEQARLYERSQFKELNRLKKLAKDTGSVAAKNVIYAESSWQEARSKLEAARLAYDAASSEVEQGWGPVIADWLKDEDSVHYQRLVSRRDTLIQITLPIISSLPADVNVIHISRSGERSSARKAYYVSPAFVANYAAQGETYYFRTVTGKLRLGMRLHVWIPHNAEGEQGFFIPEKAIVWHAGQPWTYVQQNTKTYKRVPLADGESVSGGIFIKSKFQAGDALVVAGAQMLLSEEFRWQIQEEEDDD